MSFACNTIMFSRDKAGRLANPESVIKDLLDNFEIPIRIIKDKNDETFKKLQSYCPEIKIEYIIVIVNYMNVFSA